MTGASDHLLADWIGRTSEATDRLTPRLVEGLRAVLDGKFGADEGEPAPQLSHWLLAPEILHARDLGPDGHPALGGVLPPVPLSRRMWAAGEVSFASPLRIGETVTRRSQIAAIRERSGRSGPLVFVDIDRSWTGEDGVDRISERQTLVYRDAGGQPVSGQGDDAALGWPWRRSVEPDAVMLFRYSALTFNSHRIHYDEPYARNVEGYRGLVVHGPLIATLLCDLAARTLGQNRLARFAYRALSPAIAGERIELCGLPEGNPIRLCALGGDRRRLMDAEATTAYP